VTLAGRVSGGFWRTAACRYVTAAQIGGRTRDPDIPFLQGPSGNTTGIGIDNISISQGRRVLLAEDNLINQKVAQMMLTNLGMVVEVANNGKEAMENILRSQEGGRQFHCVLMDMAMPVMGGVDATLVLIPPPSPSSSPFPAM